MKKLIAAFAVAFVALCQGCQHGSADKVVYVDTLDFRDGDLLFREGPSLESRAVEIVSTAQFSHAGILLHHSGQWCVVHAVPDESGDGIDRVKCEPIREFLRGDRCVTAASKKIDCSDSIASAAARYAYSKVGVIFDNDYELNDTSRYYCTELLWQAYLHQGIDITRGRRHGGNIFPEDILP